MSLYLKLQGKYQNVSRLSAGASTPTVTQFASSSETFRQRKHINRKKWGLCLSVADSNQLTTEAGDNASKTSTSASEDPIPAVSSSSLDTSANNSELQSSAVNEPSSQTSEASNGSSVISSQT